MKGYLVNHKVFKGYIVTRTSTDKYSWVIHKYLIKGRRRERESHGREKGLSLGRKKDRGRGEGKAIRMKGDRE